MKNNQFLQQDFWDKLAHANSAMDELLKAVPAHEEQLKKDRERATEMRGDKGHMLASKIKSAIKAKGLKQKQFAAKMGVQQSVVTRWLKGDHNFTIETLFKIEQVLGIEIILVG